MTIFIFLGSLLGAMAIGMPDRLFAAAVAASR